jgi:DNA-binding Lrp family transcriptional regulator
MLLGGGIMATKAFMLIETAAGRAGDVIDRLQKFPEIKSIDAVDGLYDVIAIIEQEDLSSIGRLIANEIPPIDGISCTVVSVCVY